MPFPCPVGGEYLDFREPTVFRQVSLRRSPAFRDGMPWRTFLSAETDFGDVQAQFASTSLGQWLVGMDTCRGEDPTYPSVLFD